MQFDVRRARALAAGDHLTVTGAPGLRLEATGAGRAWTYRYKSPVDGRMRQLKLGQWPAMSAAQAGVEWERLRAQRDAGRCPASEKREARHAAAAQPATSATTGACETVGDLVDAYVDWAAPRRVAKGAAELRRTVDRMVPDRLRRMAPAAVTRSVAYDLIETYADRPVQAANLRRELGAAWDWGHDSGRLDEDVPNWWRQVLRGKLQSRGKVVGGEHQGVTKRVLEVEEVGRVLRELESHSRLIRHLITLYLWTGCRGAELVQMEGSEVSADAAGQLWWTLPRAKTKMGRHELAQDQPVPLIGRAADIVRERLQLYGAEYLFPAVTRNSRSPHVQQKVVGVAVWSHMPDCELRPEWVRPRWSVTGWAPHDLRRTVRTQLARLGCPKHVAEAILGHIDPDVGVYDRHDYLAERLEWLTRLAETWEQACRR